MPDNTAQLRELLPLQATVDQYPNLFPSISSIRWFIFVNRPELEQQGIVVKHRNRLFINPVALANRLSL
jgi:hypothetical protein